MRESLLVVALMGALASGAAAQQAAPTPLEVLLESRTQLALTAEQLTRLQAIRASLAQRNEPLIAKMTEYRAQYQRETRAAARASGAGRRGQAAIRQATPLLGQQAQPSGNPRIEEIRGQAQALLDQIQANNRAAMEEARQILTPRQRQRLRQLIDERKPAAQPRPGPAGARAGAPRPPGFER